MAPRLPRLDLSILISSGLSGPFCLFLLPIAVWHCLSANAPAVLRRVLVIAGCATLQALCLLTTAHATRTAAPLGASLLGLCKILSGQIIAGAVLGSRAMSHIANTSLFQSPLTQLALAAFGATIVVSAAKYASSALRKFLLYAALVLAASLIEPQVAVSAPQWPVLARIGSGSRYFLIPMLAWLCACLYLATCKRAVWSRCLALCALALLPIGIVQDWSRGTLPPTDFARRAAWFKSAPAGTIAIFPIHPHNFPPMSLTKR
jgi:hypothetical protein